MFSPKQVPALRTVGDLTSDWLTGALGHPVAGAKAEKVGTGELSDAFRVTYYDEADSKREEKSVIIKLASNRPQSREVAIKYGAYAREVDFYNQLSVRLGDSVPPFSFAATDDEGFFCVVLADLRNAVSADQLKGATFDEARAALKALAQVQGPFVEERELGRSTSCLNQPSMFTAELYRQIFPEFIRRYKDRLDPAHAEICEWFYDHADAWYTDLRSPQGIMHGDFRLDNILFVDGRAVLIDWQTLSWGSAMRDAAYFMANSLTLDDRRKHEEQLFDEYFTELQRNTKVPLNKATTWQEYVRQSLFGILLAATSVTVLELSERAKVLGLNMFAGHAQQAIDLRAREVVENLNSDRLPN
jgi:hypothetical protein